MKLKSLARLGAVAALVAAFAAPVTAADYPTRPITMIVGSGAGGINDLIARILGEHMSRTLGQPVVVENQPGGGSTIAISQVAKATPDGYTLLVNGSVHSVVGELYPKSGIDVQKDLESVSLLAGVPLILTVAKALPITDFASLVAYAKEHPNQLTFGSNGRGSGAHLAAELVKSMAGVQFKHIPYRTTPQALNDLLTGRISIMLGTVTMFSPHIDSGEVRPIAVSTGERSALVPNVPTFDELGLKGYEASSWTALYAPKGTPPEIIARINTGIAAALADEEVKKRFVQLGLIAPPELGPKYLTSYLDKDIARWSTVLRASQD
ncbi:tripartite tricarboxylate transporter substrate binding protein [Ancylobacter sp. A5.8]|uniref:Bug family tripartite tricarboxylate transporter substrate binding protein n=1 Tax=Ancylobacter gelatini TaxID=2919920 RepID=UPI001F4E3F75|nr:tripartite tricarboxylate transporter substrate binding protein [Ancylobacter gelatini]MCJ8144002.1 tripartite tricarboxylate transporter substrate binding protein [Ancylobacter gelatini]